MHNSEPNSLEFSRSTLMLHTDASNDDFLLFDTPSQLYTTLTWSFKNVAHINRNNVLLIFHSFRKQWLVVHRLFCILWTLGDWNCVLVNQFHIIKIFLTVINDTVSFILISILSFHQHTFLYGKVNFLNPKTEIRRWRRLGTFTKLRVMAGQST